MVTYIGIPQTSVLVKGAGDNHGVVRTPGDITNALASMVREDMCDGKGMGIPYLDMLPAPAGCQARAVMRESHRPDFSSKLA